MIRQHQEPAVQQIIADNTISQPLLQNLLSTVERQIGKSAFDVWFRNSVHLAIDGDTVTIGAPNAFICDYLETRYAKIVSKALADCGGRPFELKFHVDPALFQQRRQHQMQQTAEFLESAPADGSPTHISAASSPAQP